MVSVLSDGTLNLGPPVFNCISGLVSESFILPNTSSFVAGCVLPIPTLDDVLIPAVVFSHIDSPPPLPASPFCPLAPELENS